MALDPRMQAALALHRFGFAPRPGGLAKAAADPRGALLAELDDPAAGRIDNADLPDTASAFRAAFDFRQDRKRQRQARAAQNKMRDAMQDNAASAAAVTPNSAPMPDGKAEKPGPGVPRQLYLDDAKARLDAALAAETGFVERLVWFWSNHFCVSAAKGKVRPICGAFEREAIRPHVRGSFVDMLTAVESHPAMLLYLDNARSMGPNSIAGRRRGKGLNENLARETLELHTLGVRTGYSQDDVTGYAKVITGWSVVPPRRDDGGAFVFNPRLHEPGAQRVIGRDYADRGVEQGRAVLRDLARSPATAGHIAGKLARHFVSDQPPPALTARLSKVYLDTDGNLKELARALVAAPESWDTARTKFRRPSEWLVGSLRATGVRPDRVQPVLQAQNLLGEPLWRPPAPNGFSDDSGTWMDGVAQRLDIANRFARKHGDKLDARAIAEDTFGPVLSAETRHTVARAESRQQALALLLMAPEFQRR